MTLGRHVDARFREPDELLGEEGHADRNGRLGQSVQYARVCEFIVDPDGRRGSRAREPINRDPRKNCETNSVGFESVISWVLMHLRRRSTDMRLSTRQASRKSMSAGRPVSQPG